MKRIRMIIFSACSAVLTFASVQETIPANAIIQGNATSPSAQFPWVGQLHGLTPAGKTETCTASLVDRSWAITALHCFSPSTNLQSFKITFDYYDDRDTVATAVTREIDGVRGYASEDIALVHLTSPVDSIDPVTLARPQDSADWRKKTPETIVGWGELAVKNGDNHNLRWADHVVVDPSASVTDLTGIQGPIRTAPAPDSSGEWAYEGDSGGPLLYYNSATGLYTQVGVFSHFEGGCKTKYGVTICTSIFRNWWGKLGKSDVTKWMSSYLVDQGTSVPWNSAAGDAWTATTGTSGLAELTYGQGGCETIDSNAQCTGGTWPIIPGAPYIWAHRLTQAETTVTFTKTFRVTAEQSTMQMQLTAWADDNFVASLNGSTVLSGSYADAPGTAAVSVHSGMNTITFTVSNVGGHDQQENPAGLAWKIAPATTIQH